MPDRLGHGFDGSSERRLVYPRRLGEPGSLPDELEGGFSDLVGSCWRVEIVQRPDVSAHHNLSCVRAGPETAEIEKTLRASSTWRPRGKTYQPRPFFPFRAVQDKGRRRRR